MPTPEELSESSGTEESPCSETGSSKSQIINFDSETLKQVQTDNNIDIKELKKALKMSIDTKPKSSEITSSSSPKSTYLGIQPEDKSRNINNNNNLNISNIPLPQSKTQSSLNINNNNNLNGRSRRSQSHGDVGSPSATSPSPIVPKMSPPSVSRTSRLRDFFSPRIRSPAEIPVAQNLQKSSPKMVSSYLPMSEPMDVKTRPADQSSDLNISSTDHSYHQIDPSSAKQVSSDIIQRHSQQPKGKNLAVTPTPSPKVIAKTPQSDNIQSEPKSEGKVSTSSIDNLPPGPPCVPYQSVEFVDIVLPPREALRTSTEPKAIRSVDRTARKVSETPGAPSVSQTEVKTEEIKSEVIKKSHEDIVCSSEMTDDEKRQLQQAIEESLKDVQDVSPQLTGTPYESRPPRDVPSSDFVRKLLSDCVPFDDKYSAHFPTSISYFLETDESVPQYCATEEEIRECFKRYSLTRWSSRRYADELWDDSVTPFDVSAHYLEMNPHTQISYCKMATDFGMRIMESSDQGSLFDITFGRQPQIQLSEFKRWLRHPFVFHRNPLYSSALVQLCSGPCGVIAPVQAILWQRLFFSSVFQSRQLSQTPEATLEPFGGLSANSPISSLTEVQLVAEKLFQNAMTVREAFAETLAFIIAQGALPSPDPSYYVCWMVPIICETNECLPRRPLLSEMSFAFNPNSPYDDFNDFPGYTIKRIFMSSKILYRRFKKVKHLIQFVFVNYSWLFCAPRVPGLLNLVLSVAASRGPSKILTEDFETDCQSSLLGTFGHCNQELLNLILVGRATANLFDGSSALSSHAGLTQVPGDTVVNSSSGLLLKGVPKRSLVGYLSEMEALRYCDVGNNYKHPFYPIWVSGSSDHFTVLLTFNINHVRKPKSFAAREFAKNKFSTLCLDGSGLLLRDDVKRLIRITGFQLSSADISRLAHDLAPAAEGDVLLESKFTDWFVERCNKSEEFVEMVSNIPERLRYESIPFSKLEEPLLFIHYDESASVLLNQNRNGIDIRWPEMNLTLWSSTGDAGGIVGKSSLQEIMRTRWGPDGCILKTAPDCLKTILESFNV